MINPLDTSLNQINQTLPLASGPSSEANGQPSYPQTPSLSDYPYSTSDLDEALDPTAADLLENAKDTQSKGETLEYHLGHGLSLADAYKLAQMNDAAQNSNPNASIPHTAFDSLTSQAQSELVQHPSYPQYQPPQLNPTQGLALALGAVMDPKHSANDVAAGLQGNSQMNNLMYQRALHQYGAEMQAREEQIKNILTLAGMQNGRDEAQARLDAEVLYHDAIAQYRKSVLQERMQNHLQQQYERASGLDQKLQIGRQLGFSDDQIQRDFAASRDDNTLNATMKWEQMLSGEESPTLHVVDADRAASLNKLRTALASHYGISIDNLRPPQTFEDRLTARSAALHQQWSTVKGGDTYYKREVALDEAEQRVLRAVEQYNSAPKGPAQDIALQEYRKAAQRYNSLDPAAFNADVAKIGMQSHQRPEIYPTLGGQIDIGKFVPDPNSVLPVNPLVGPIPYLK